MNIFSKVSSNNQPTFFSLSYHSYTERFCLHILSVVLATVTGILLGHKMGNVTLKGN